MGHPTTVYHRIIYTISCRDREMESCMVKTTKAMAVQQVNPYGAYKGADALVIDDNNSMHYDAKIDRQIRIPIPDVREYLRKLKGDA